MHPVEEAPPKPSRGAAVGFHLVGLVLSAAVAGYLLLLAAVQLFFNLGCDGDAYVPYLSAPEVRSLVLTHGLGLALVPAAWAGLARAIRLSWRGWAALAGTLILLTTYLAWFEAADLGC